MLDNAAVVALLGFAAFVLAYFTYGRFIARRVCRLDPNRRTPAHELEDGVDYVPTRIPVLFGHHFASIAGLGPILGPAIAVIWGWVPAMLWVMIGCIFIGAVHDLGALAVSLRFKGRTIGDCCQDLMGPRARLLALLIIYLLLALAMGAFVNVISRLFVGYNPDAIIPSFGLMLVAMVVGIAVYRFKAGLGPATVLALAAFAALIFWGVEQPVLTYDWLMPKDVREAIATAKTTPLTDPQGNVLVESLQMERPYGSSQITKHFVMMDHALVAEIDKAKAAGDNQRLAALESQAAAVATEAGRFKDVTDGTQDTWVWVLLGYAFLASVLPVWMLLQPRDYINSFQLYFALAALLLGLSIAAVTGDPASHIHAEAFRPVVPMNPLLPGQSIDSVPHAPDWFPLLFVTVACGAVSGFHSLVSSGTTVRQLNRESDALPIGYGAMLTEGALAVLVIMACVAGLGSAAWQQGGEYSSWVAISGGGLAAQLHAVVRGGANFLAQLGIPLKFGTALLAVTIVAFALTTLDTGTRLLRFNVEAIFRSVRLSWLANRYVASGVAVATIAFFGLVDAGKTLWTLFGTTNQLLAGLTLLMVSLFLYKLGRPIVYTLLPMVLMLILSVWALVESVFGFWKDARLTEFNRWSLTVVSLVVLAMSLWLLVEGLLSFARGRGGLGFDEPQEPSPPSQEEIAAVDSAHLG
jgi:carbon starvation protein